MAGTLWASRLCSFSLAKRQAISGRMLSHAGGSWQVVRFWQLSCSSSMFLALRASLKYAKVFLWCCGRLEAWVRVLWKGTRTP